MSYGMIGSGKFSSRLHKARKLREKAMELLTITPDRDSDLYKRRLNRYRSLERLYSEVYRGINDGRLSPDYPKTEQEVSS